MNITFVTGNASKAKHLVANLGIFIQHKDVDLDEIQSLNPIDIVTDKARRAYEIMKSPVLIEDVSLTFHALGNLPGPLIKWFVQELKPQGLCNLLSKDRRATATVIYVIYDGLEMNYFSGSRTGTISQSPRGQPRFAWDNIFIPDGHAKSWSEFDDESFAKSSMRAPAIDELRQFLKENSKRYS